MVKILGQYPKFQPIILVNFNYTNLGGWVGCVGLIVFLGFVTFKVWPELINFKHEILYT